MSAIKVVIAGCSGRMGRVLLDCVAQADDLALHAALDHASSPHLGKDASEFGGTRGVAVTADAATALQGADVLIDFTRPEGTLHHLEICQQYGVNIVIGTTGFSAQEKAVLGAAAQNIDVMLGLESDADYGLAD